MLHYTCNHKYINKIVVKLYRYNIKLNVYIQNQSQCSFLNKYSIVLNSMNIDIKNRHMSHRAVVIILLHQIKRCTIEPWLTILNTNN